MLNDGNSMYVVLVLHIGSWLTVSRSQSLARTPKILLLRRRQPAKMLLHRELILSFRMLAMTDSTSRQGGAVVEKSEQEIQQEIQSIFRQITASVTFLPMLDGNCTFNVLVYADADSDVPLEWGDSDAKDIKNGEKVQLRSFSTNSHKVDTLVSYR